MKRNNVFNNNIIKWGVMPLLLLGIWLMLTFLYILYYDESATVVSYNHNKENFTQIPEGKLLKGQKITGEFTAQDNNLGILAIRFKQQQRIPWKEEDLLTFRIKEKGAKEWYYQNNYYSGLTFDVPFLPIGFPVIQNAKGKIYHFELGSNRGNEKNGLILSDKRPILVSRYQMDKQELLHNPSKLAHFLYIKLMNSFGTPDVLYSSFAYLFPLIFYLLLISGILKRLVSPLHPILKPIEESRAFKKVSSVFEQKDNIALFFMTVLMAAIFYDIFILQVLNDIVYIVIIMLWLVVLRFGKMDNRATFIAALLLLIIAPFALEFDSKAIAEKAAAWSFIFLSGGVISEMILLRKAKK